MLIVYPGQIKGHPSGISQYLYVGLSLPGLSLEQIIRESKKGPLHSLLLSVTDLLLGLAASLSHSAVHLRSADFLPSPAALTLAYSYRLSTVG